MWLKLIANKYFIFGIILVGMIAYYEIQGLSYRIDIVNISEELVSSQEDANNFKDARNDLEQKLKSNIKVNDINIEEIKKYQKSFESAELIYNKQLSEYKFQIKRLIITINNLKNLPDPHISNNNTIIDNCIIYKGVDDESIYNLSNIGK